MQFTQLKRSQMQISSTGLYVVLFSLYWAQGLPVGFMTHALPVILRANGVSLAHIGGFGVLMAPWALKVLWAPWVDAYALQRWGHYRSWIIATQLLSVLILIGLSFIPISALDQPRYLFLFFIGLLFMNTVGATQDIATDALAVKLLKQKQQQWGNMLQVIGSRLGFIVGGGAILWLLDLLTWQSTFLILAALVALNTWPILRFQEAPRADRHQPKHPHNSQNIMQSIKQYSKQSHSPNKPQRYVDAWRACVGYFAQSKELQAWFWVLCSIKVSDGLSGPILKPLLVDLGLSLSQIGIYITMFGAMAALLGAALAAVLLRFLSRSQALLLFSLFKLASLMGYAILAWRFEQGAATPVLWIYILNALEDLFAAMLLVVILTVVMQYSRQNNAATDFTLQVSLMALVSGVLYSLSGVLGQYLGYQNYLIVICIVASTMLWPILKWQAAYTKASLTESN